MNERMPTAVQPPTADAAAALPRETTASKPANVSTRLRRAADRNVFVIATLGVCCAVQARLIRGSLISDSWYTLLGGRTVIRSGLPHHDVLTAMTLGHPWVDQQWLAQLGFYGLWSAGGWPLALLGDVVLFLSAFIVLAAAARRFGASDRSVALISAVCFLTGLPNTVLRAQIFAYVLFALLLVLLLADERRPSRRVLLVLPLLVLWANIHGSVVLGATLVALRGVTIAARSLRARAGIRSWLPQATALIALPWLCTLASPYGFALPSYYRSVLGNSTLENLVSEWGASTLRGQPFFYGLLFLALLLVARSPAATTPLARLALAGTAVAGLLAVRNDVWFALVCAAVLPAALDAIWAPAAAARRTGINFALAATGVVAALAVSTAMLAHASGWFEQGYPARAAASVASAVRANPGLRIFSDERYSDWLLLEDPQLAGRIAYDIRFELLSSGQLSTLFAFRTEHGLDWQRAARGYGVLVLDPIGDAGAVRLYERRPGTKVLYRDGKIVVLRVKGGRG